MAKAAFHEAGHAVVAWSFCLSVEHIELDVRNNSGHVKMAPPEEAVHRVAV
jgi:Peptidase M50B-like